MSAAKCIEETVPTHLQNNGYGTSTNIFICFLIMVGLLMSIGMPTSDEDLEKTNFWRFIYAFPVIFMLPELALTLFVYKEDSLEFLVKTG